MLKNQYHVVYRGGQWVVKKAGAKRASGVFPTKEKAVKYGRELSRSQGSELVIHKKDGKIQDLDSHGRDPIPPRDRRYRNKR